jgi:hypothetical protein
MLNSFGRPLSRQQQEQAAVEAAQQQQLLQQQQQEEAAAASKKRTTIIIVVVVVVILLIVGYFVAAYIFKFPPFSKSTTITLPVCTTTEMKFNTCVSDSKGLNTGTANYITSDATKCTTNSTPISDLTHCPIGQTTVIPGNTITGSTEFSSDVGGFKCRFDQLVTQNKCQKDTNGFYTGVGFYSVLPNAPATCGDLTSTYTVKNDPICSALCPDSLYSINNPAVTTQTITCISDLKTPATVTETRYLKTSSTICPPTKQFPSQVCICPQSLYKAPTTLNDSTCDFKSGSRSWDFDTTKVPTGYPQVKPDLCPTTYLVPDPTCSCSNALNTRCKAVISGTPCTSQSDGTYKTNYTYGDTSSTATCPDLCKTSLLTSTPIPATTCGPTDVTCTDNCQTIPNITGSICYKSGTNNFDFNLLQNTKGTGTTTTCNKYCLLTPSPSSGPCTLLKNSTICPKGDADSDGDMYGRCTPFQHIVTLNGKRTCFPPINTSENSLDAIKSIIPNCDPDSNNFSNLFPSLINTPFYISAVECSNPATDLNNLKVLTIDSTDGDANKLIKWDNYSVTNKINQLWKITSYNRVSDTAYQMKITSNADATNVACLRNDGGEYFRYWTSNPDNCKPSDLNSLFFMVKSNYYNNGDGGNDGNSNTYIGNLKDKPNAWMLRFYQLSSNSELFLTSNSANNNVSCSGTITRSYHINSDHTYRYFMFADPTVTASSTTV